MIKRTIALPAAALIVGLVLGAGAAHTGSNTPEACTTALASADQLLASIGSVQTTLADAMTSIASGDVTAIQNVSSEVSSKTPEIRAERAAYDAAKPSCLGK
jgi:hypothetical protein